MSTGLKITIIIVSIVVFNAAIVAVAFFATSKLPKAADQFFSALKDDNLDQAYQLTSTQFQQSVPYEQFQDYVKKLSLGAYRGGPWSARSIQNDYGRLEGSLTASDGSKIPVIIEFLYEKGVWRIQNITFQSAGVNVTSP